MGLFSIVTIQRDSAAFNRFCKLSFAIATGINMLLTSVLVAAHKKTDPKRLDVISLILKISSTAAFCYVSPLYFQRHQADISFPPCHSYCIITVTQADLVCECYDGGEASLIPRMHAMLEYVMIVAYAAFHLSLLIDIRHITFLCYPRTCSGECEPLEPRNFEKGAKYEHCRAYELQQRRIAQAVYRF